MKFCEIIFDRTSKGMSMKRKKKEGEVSKSMGRKWLTSDGLPTTFQCDEEFEYFQKKRKFKFTDVQIQEMYNRRKRKMLELNINKN